ncbi:S41 family peptidase [Neolewinella lacunae]|uniref:Tail specific protease domain-containing protein n=1 Tax=Neolewinella lacunae TaxID=1517758 RepID=A0A923PNZ2_9BACT|nr:S41 family peptidase [Neolewinella lacunae]MBC6995161.1 hypothetical protein [Neolewinella lacunae]MDN3634111.1 S41 family peptidase [Neolewinella lacunae]
MQHASVPTLLLILFLCTCGRAQESLTNDFSYFPAMAASAANLDYLTSNGKIGPVDALVASLTSTEDLRPTPPDYLRIGDTLLPLAGGTTAVHLTGNDGRDWVTIHTLSPDDAKPRRTMWNAIGTYTGTQYDHACFYLKLEKGQPHSLQATALFGSTVLSLGRTFPISLAQYNELPNAAQRAVYQEAVTTLERRILALAEHLLPAEQLLYLARPSSPMTAAERTFGLVQFWTEVKYNFAYFDQVPALNWDAALLEYLPLAAAEQTNAAYFRLLERFCALLQDGHTNVYPPPYLRSYYDRPQLKIELVEGQPVVVNHAVGLGQTVPLGARITAVEGRSVEAHLEENIYPYISIGSPEIRRRWGAHDVLKGPSGTNVTFTFQTVEGGEKTVTLPRNRDKNWITWAVDEPQRPLTAFTVLEGGIGHLTLNSFGDENAATEFLTYWPEIRKCRGLVIDLRYNGGGNSDVGYAVLKHFTGQPVLTSAWRTREMRSANRAWGQFMAGEDPANLSEDDARNVAMYRGDYWFLGAPDTIWPAADALASLPVAVLVSNYTASAAEDFLVAADALPNFTFVGEASFGSTGQPIQLRLPGGGSARVCTKRDTYPDGRVFVGPGVQVDVPVRPTIAEYLAKKDVVLERALQGIKGERNKGGRE